MDSTHYFPCECGSAEHVFRVCLDDADGDLWLETHLSTYLPWWRRIVRAFTYVVGRRSRYGDWDTVLISYDDAVRLRDLMDRAIKTKEKFR